MTTTLPRKQKDIVVISDSEDEDDIEENDISGLFIIKLPAHVFNSAYIIDPAPSSLGASLNPQMQSPNSSQINQQKLVPSLKALGKRRKLSGEFLNYYPIT